MKRLLFALVLGSSVPAWALDELAVRSLSITRTKVTAALTDASWLHADQNVIDRYSRDLELIGEEADTISMLIDDNDPAQPLLAELNNLSKISFNHSGEGHEAMLELFDALLNARRVLTDLTHPVVMHDGEHWAETKPGKMLKIESERIHNILRSYSGDVDRSFPRLLNSEALGGLMQPFIDRMFFLSRLTNDRNVKISIERIGAFWEERHVIAPTLAHPNASLVQERASILKIYEEFDDLRRTLDREGLDCSMDLAGPAGRSGVLANLLRTPIPHPPKPTQTPEH